MPAHVPTPAPPGADGAWGMVHGRFQPFHNGHLAYLRAAAARCERLLVGITNPDRSHTRAEPADAARHLPEANPFTYTERMLMVGAALAGEGGAVPVAIIPFPISEPELWPEYVPGGTVHYLRLRSAWSAAKAERLRAHGHPVEILDDSTAADVSGARVRAAIRDGGDWEALVPPGVAALIRSLPTRAPAPRPPA